MRKTIAALFVLAALAAVPAAPNPPILIEVDHFGHLIRIPVEAVPAHRNHGDCIAPCSGGR